MPLEITVGPPEFVIRELMTALWGLEAREAPQPVLSEVP